MAAADAGRIFPSSVSYLNSFGGRTTATLVGIAPQAPCGSTVDAAAAPVLAAAGCVTVLRATYTDASQTAVATIGIAVLRSPATRSERRAPLWRAAAAGCWRSASPAPWRACSPAAPARLTPRRPPPVATFPLRRGYTDGRSTTLQVNSDGGYTGETVTTDLGNGVVSQLSAEFQAPPRPCADKNVRC